MPSRTEPRTTEIISPQSESAAFEPTAAGAPISILATSTTVPEYKFGLAEAKAYLNKVFPLNESRTAMMLEVLVNSQIAHRHCIFPLDYTIQPRPLGQTSKEYAEHSIILGRRVAADCLERAGLAATDIDLLITVSCTGVMIPSLDAHLVNEMGFRADVRRLPITELGCAGGAAALGRAWDFLRGVPEGKVLIVIVELPSVTFQRTDVSPANLISAALFGDGAAAAVVSRSPSTLSGARTASGNGKGHECFPRILATRSYLFPNSTDAMGFDLKETGFHIVLSKDVPQLIRDKIRGLVDGFLELHGLSQQDMAAFVLHPGGQKLLSYIEEELGLAKNLTQYSWDVLRDYGNLSSASVLFVLQEWMRKGQVAAGSYGLLAAFGPGFSAEMLLLQWE
jgi:alkylresorcinol/alkylpyrone synthase